MVLYGMRRASLASRIGGIAVFGLTVGKVFLYDLAELQALWRVLSFVVVSLLLIGVSYLYHLYGESIFGAGRAEPDAAGGEPAAPPGPEGDEQR
jgi:uncharacterized membrane protein